MTTSIWYLILSIIFAALAATAVRIIVESYKNSIEKKAIKSSILCEMRCIELSIARMGYDKDLDKLISKASEHKYSYQIKIAEEWNIVFRNCCSKIGMLDSDSAEKIIQYYHNMQTLVIETSEGGSLSRGSNRDGFELARKTLEDARNILASIN